MWTKKRSLLAERVDRRDERREQRARARDPKISTCRQAGTGVPRPASVRARAVVEEREHRRSAQLRGSSVQSVERRALRQVSEGTAMRGGS